jgi:hypothetical protein
MTNRDAYQLINVLLDMATPAADTKLEHAHTETMKNAQPFITKYNEKIRNLHIDYCSTDERGNIIRDQHREYLFTKENQKLLDAEIQKFLNADVIVPFEIVATSDKKGLSEVQIEYLKNMGFIKDLKVLITE